MSLEYREVDADLVSYGLSIIPQDKPFAKEPAAAGGTLQRGTLRLSVVDAWSKRFIWDVRNGQVYLDLNDNGDLTDDSGGVFSCLSGLQSQNYQQFEDIQLELPLNGLLHRMRFDLSLYSFGQLGGSIALRSYWSGKAVLQGREWELGLVPQFHHGGSVVEGEMLLRSWAAQGSGFSVGDGSLVTFPCGTNLFFLGQAYGLQRTASTEAPLRVEMVLTPREAELGEVQFTGRHIGRALLRGDPWTAVLEEPAGTVKVPRGSYASSQVHVRLGETEARPQHVWTDPQQVPGSMVVGAGSTVVVTAGGPLTNTVSVQQRGQSLVLSYQLVGAGGEVYQPLMRSRGQPPRFTVHLGDKEVASGSFEFG